MSGVPLHLFTLSIITMSHYLLDIVITDGESEYGDKTLLEVNSPASVPQSVHDQILTILGIEKNETEIKLIGNSKMEIEAEGDYRTVECTWEEIPQADFEVLTRYL